METIASDLQLSVGGVSTNSGSSYGFSSYKKKKQTLDTSISSPRKPKQPSVTTEFSYVKKEYSDCDREEPNCPKKTVEEPKGIEVLIDYEDVAIGETTRSLSSGRSLGRLGEGFDVEADGLKLYGITYDKSDNPLPINPELTFYAKENVVFQGWSWRYGTDKPGTQRDSKGNIISDYIATPALQPDAGQHKLDLSTDKTSFTCKYDPNSDNKVYVKVRYIIRDDLKGFPSMDDLSSITCIPPISHPLLPPSTIQDCQRLTYKVGCSLFINGIAYPEQIDRETGKSYAYKYKGWKEYYDFLVDIKDQVKKKSLAGTQRVPNPLKPGEWIVKVPYKDQVETMERIVNRWKLIGSFIENDMLLWD